MPTYAILLRGVNVGKGNRVPMADFRVLLEGLGCANVRTLLNSGNAVVSSTARSTSSLARAVRDALEAQFGFQLPVIVTSARALGEIVAQSPMVPPASDHSRFLVAFGPDEAALRALEPLGTLTGPRERFVITSRAAYLHCPDGLLTSRLGEAMLGKAGRGVTSRNWGTVLKLHALANGD